MGNPFHVSEAAALGLHAAAILAGTRDRRVQAREIAVSLKASEAHLAKVMLALRRAGIIKSVRGPAGGSMLARPPEKITLRQIYEAIEGPLKINRCMFSEPVCGRSRCGLGGFLRSVDDQVRSKLDGTKLSEFTLQLGGNDGKQKKHHQS